ncbi:MAG: hypothetical protein AAF989_07620 [Planctomycetota bacterium]
MLSNPFPEYGIFPRWPEDGQSFVHPSDVAIVRRCIPSERVFRRDSFDGTYYQYQYGTTRFRLRPCMWLKVSIDGIDVGDQVETIGQGLERELFVATVWGMHFVRRKGRIVYRLRRGNQLVPNLYTAEHLRLITNKKTIREGFTQHPSPTWDGSGETTPLD